jgi:ActR/RegA family two-component response regulator
VVDYRLPDGDGLVAITRLKELQPGIRTVLLTGHGDEKMKEATQSLQSAYFDKAEMRSFWNFLENLPFQRLAVLLVDDDRSFLQSLASRVRLRGYQALLAETGAEAVELAGKSRVHLAVVDHQLPDMDGLTVITKLKQSRPDLETILLTAFGSDKLREATQALNSAYSDKGEMKGFWGMFRRILRRLELTMAAAGMAAGGDAEDALRLEKSDDDTE